mmetsp:Transcript_18207/g.59104  ORF Transcript_18207/g.59104 Transcript_18207/m.59104 type:complete len:95 (-) Transcript_18207:44-328(-)
MEFRGENITPSVAVVEVGNLKIGFDSKRSGGETAASKSLVEAKTASLEEASTASLEEPEGEPEGHIKGSHTSAPKVRVVSAQWACFEFFSFYCF